MERSAGRLIFNLIFVISPLITGCEGSPLDGFFGESSNNSPVIPAEPFVLPTFSPSAPDSQLSFGYPGIDSTLDVDFNQDGIKDLIVSAMFENSMEGAYYVLSGADMSELYTVKGPSGYTFFGGAIKVFEDMDSDGIPDIVSGAISGGSGKMVATSGASGSLIWETTVNETWFGHSGNYFQIDDLNVDGVKDIIVSSRVANSSDGMIWALSAIDGSILWSKLGSGGLSPGLELESIIPDYLAADGTPDLVVTNDDKMQILSGADGSVLLDCAAITTHTAHPIPDQTSDGIPDYLLAYQSYNSGRGMIQLISGADCSSVYLVSGENANDSLRYYDTKIKDQNSDGVDDLLVHAPDFNSSQGKIYVISTADGSILSSVTGAGASSVLQNPNSSEQDYDGDGFHDYHATEGYSSGKKYVIFFSGQDSSKLFQFESELTVGGALRVESTLYDINSDGYDDIIISDKNADNDRGKVYVYSGLDQSQLIVLEGENEGDLFGASFLAKDEDEDGNFEFHISASGYNSDSGKVYKYTDLINEK